MKIFVAGATGVIGLPTVRRLLAAGHDVTAVARRTERADALRRLGATTVAVDLFDPTEVRLAVEGHDAVVNLATHIPSVRPMSKAQEWEENSRPRNEASGHLVDAALAAGAAVFVQESIALLYEDSGDGWVDEYTPFVDSPPTGPVQRAEANAARFAASGRRGVVLRFGGFYGAASEQTRLQVRAARQGISLDGGAPDAYFPVIAVDDAAAAVVAAVAEAPSGAYNIVDDEPMTMRQSAAVWSQVIGRRVHRLPERVAALAGPSASFTRRSMRVSNRRFEDVTSWTPQAATILSGLPPVVEALGGPAHRLSSVARIALWILALTALALGAQALFSPRAFFDDFPFGRGWVAADGPYNEHLVRDFGALNLALAVMTAGALVVRRGSGAVIAALAWLAFAVPHFAYHLGHLDMYGTGDAIGNVAAVGATMLLALLVLVSVLGAPEAAVRPWPGEDQDRRTEPPRPELLQVGR